MLIHLLITRVLHSMWPGLSHLRLYEEILRIIITSDQHKILQQLYIRLGGGTVRSNGYYIILCISFWMFLPKSRRPSKINRHCPDTLIVVRICRLAFSLPVVSLPTMIMRSIERYANTRQWLSRGCLNGTTKCAFMFFALQKNVFYSCKDKDQCGTVSCSI